MKKARSLFSVSILAMVLYVSGFGLTPYATAHEITNIELSPPSPAALLNNEYVDVTFDYSTTEAGGVLIVTIPYTNGFPTSPYAYCGLPVYYGSGAGSCCFRVMSGDVIVDQIRFRMYNADASVVLLEFFIDVEYHYGNSITNIELSPPSPATLLPLDKVNIMFDYATTHPDDVLIFARPFTNGSKTPGSYTHPSPYYPSGKGSGTGWFTFPYGGVVVDEIRIWMTDIDQTAVIYELFIPVGYRFCDGTCTWYVDADAPGTNTGVDWTNAFNHLQDALAVAALGDEIKVAEGTYKPDEGGGQTPGDRAAAFQLISGVTIRGGYAGWSEPEPDVRNIGVYETILSGDIGTQGNNLDNSYHVVTGSGIDETAYLEGFTITGGNANGTDPNDRRGGGMLNDSSSPTVTNCTFSNNTASADGGGMYNYSSSPAVTDCTFSNNTTTTTSGGGMYNNSSSPTVTQCTFTGNTAQGYGGGMYNATNSHPTVTNCLFNQNIATLSHGGGMANYNNSNSIVINCTFSLNSAGGNGGGMRNWASNPTVTNCILWGNLPDQISSSSSSPVVSYSDVQGGHAGTGNIDADPLFFDAPGGDFRFISSGSPCVDAGDNSVVTEPNDLAGNPRVVNGDGDETAIVDMGAYELQSKVHNITKDLWYGIIQTSIDDANDGDQIEVAPGTYNEAIDFKGKAVRLYSSGGPNVTTIDAYGLSSSVVSCTSGEGLNTFLEGFTITGGSGTTVGSYEYGGGMYNLNSSPMVKDCNFTTNSVTGDGGGMYNNNSSPTVANCSFSANNAVWAGGGMDNRNSSSPTVADCTFSQNTAGTNGGGLENWTDSNSTVTNCTFISNSAEVWGGGMFNDNSSPTVTNCTFSNNSALYAGGMHNNYSSPTVTNCNFNGNSATYGGGMRNDLYSSSTITNCNFTENSAALEGGGMRNYASNPTVTNCTFSGNAAGNNGGGMHNHISSPTLTNCIFWNDAPDEIFNNTSSPTVTYCDVQGTLWPGAGNINADPCFVDAAGGDLRLATDSPCIDIGDNNAPGLSATDLAGNRRVFDGDGDGSTIVDMGAYEFGSIKLVAHWRLDESSGDIAYDSSGDNHGTLEPGPPVWQPAGGQLGGALEFDGLNDFVSIPNESNFDVTERLTVAAWIKVAAFDRGWQAIVTKGDNAWRIQRDAQNNALEFAVSGTLPGNVLGSVNVNDGQWHHVAGVYDGTVIYLYVDGAVDNDEPASGTISTNDFPVMIGENAERLGRCWNGLMDDVSIFSRALDGTEITNLKNNGGASFLADPNLKALWELDESSGTTASDSSCDNHGTLEPGPPVWQPAGGRLGGALEFDGVDDFVSIPNESRFDITYQLTVSAWIKVTAFDKEWQAIVTKGDAAWRLHRLQDTNSIAFHCNISPHWGAEGSIGVDDGQWHHVAGVYDGTRAYLYVDGVLDNSVPAFGLINKNDYPVMIGENAELPGRCWNGLIDDVRIYTSALGPSEVYQLYSNICYVDADATGNNDGSSWTDAFNHLQDALAAQATIGSEIHVAEGTYKPDATSINPSGTGDRTATFQLVNGVILKGGYAGFGQPDPNVRDCDLYETILSGDINTPGDANDNSYHVVTSSGCDLYTVLEGFTITGGNASGTGSNGFGGGIYCESSSPTVTNCTFSVNLASHGGGMYCESSSPTVTDCNFSDNTASANGGGMYNNNSSPTVTNCTFSDNTSLDGYYGGGGMFNNTSNPTVANCSFSGNEARKGGGMYNYNNSSSKVTNCTFSNHIVIANGGGMYNRDSSPTVTNCTFTGNTALDPSYGGGGMFNYTSSPTVTNCTFSGNTASINGGGIYNYSNSSPTVNNCTFSGNSAYRGGGMYNEYSSPTATNCMFSGNSAGKNGGGMYNYDGSPTVTNCTFTGNQASSDTYGGGGMFNNTSNPTVVNCTFSGNSADKNGGGMYNYNTSSPTVTNCILWGDTPDEIVDNSSTTTITYSDIQGGYSGTGNIDADPLFVDAAAGNLRLRPGSPCVDKGSNAAVPSGITTDLDGHPRIIDGDCDEIDVVDMGAYELCRVHNVTRNLYYGTIQGAIDGANDGDQIEVASGTYNEAIIFKGKAVRLYSSDGPEVTTIDATGLSSSVVRCINGEDANTVLEGFTITGGNAYSGGGMSNNNNSSPTVTNCTFSENTATGEFGHGGGMYNNNNSSPTMTNCNFSGNTSNRHGGGMSNRQSSSPTVTNCTFTNNSSVHWGGGMYNDMGSHSIVTNCTFSGNISDTGGGGIGNFSSSPTVTNCTFSDNNSPDGGGMCNNGSSNPTVTNCILWGDIGGEIVDNYIYSTIVTYSDVEGGWGGTGNIAAGPLFVDAAGGNLRLRPGSPCVDKGSNSAVPSGITSDLDGHPRIIDGDCDDIEVVDMGAYEFALAYFGDFDNNCSVNFFDFSILARAWMTQQGDPDWDWACDISYPPDDYIDWRDAAVLCDNWLATP